MKKWPMQFDESNVQIETGVVAQLISFLDGVSVGALNYHIIVNKF